MWGEGDEGVYQKSAVSGSLRLVDHLQLTSIALPAISTGYFRFFYGPCCFFLHIHLRFFRDQFLIQIRLYGCDFV